MCSARVLCNSNGSAEPSLCSGDRVGGGRAPCSVRSHTLLLSRILWVLNSRVLHIPAWGGGQLPCASPDVRPPARFGAHSPGGCGPRSPSPGLPLRARSDMSCRKRSGIFPPSNAEPLQPFFMFPPYWVWVCGYGTHQAHTLEPLHIPIPTPMHTPICG